MLFSIDSSIAQLFASGAAGPADFDGINYVALASAEGSHRIGGNRRDLISLAGTASLPPRTANILNRAASRVSEDGSLKNRLSVYGHVVPGAGEPSSMFIAGQRIVSLPLQWFTASAKIQPAVLLGESLADAHILNKIGEVGTILSNLPRLPVSSVPLAGGGSSTAGVLQQQVDQQRLCLCIVDSDKPCPAGAIGGTAASVQPFKQTANYPLVEVLETTGRDLENHLPGRFYLSVYGAHNQYGQLAKLLDALTAAGRLDIRNHMDIEKGATLKTIISYQANSSERAFWQTSLPLIDALAGSACAASPCLVANSCAQANGACQCVVIAGNPTDILERFLSMYREATRHLLHDSLHELEKTEWRRLGHAIASWCCGDTVLRV